MRVAAILGPGGSEKNCRPFQKEPDTTWRIGLPASTTDVDAILIFGGDGTIHRHLGELVRLQRPVLIVPHGSGNDFARALGLPNVRDSLAAWRQFTSRGNNLRAVDLGVIEPADGSLHYFCTVAGVGLDGEVARRANQLPRWLRGNGGYALTLLPTLFRFAPFPMKISPPSGSHDPLRPVVLAAFANVPAYGGGMKIAPQASLGDGKMDVCVINDINKFKLFCMFPTVYFGRHLSIAEVDYFQSARAQLDTEQPMDMYADGEYVCQTPVEVQVARKILQVIVHPSQTRG